MTVSVKDRLDELFSEISFDKKLIAKLAQFNIGFITSSQEHKQLFGSRLIGCHTFSYTKYDKNKYYEQLFDLDVETVISAIKDVETIPSHFKIARDDVNLVTFYVAHRFLSNSSLNESSRMEGAKYALDYFNYRTLVLKSSEFFVYPITEEKAVTLSEHLNNKYMIKRLKNWNEYCQYRSTEFLDRKFVNVLTKMNDDKALAYGITDLYNRTKDMLINIYGEFVKMNEGDEIIKSRKNTATDVEGKEVVVDRVDSPSLVVGRVESSMVDRNSFIKKDLIDVATDIVNAVSYSQMEETLTVILAYHDKDNNSGKEVNKFIQDFLINCFEYLQQTNTPIGKGAAVINVVNTIAGSVLYARGTDVGITKVKTDGEKLIKKAYKSSGTYISDRNLKNVRNAFCIYILLLALL